MTDSTSKFQNVVVIDDNSTNKYLIETILDSFGFNMFFYDNSREFLEDLQNIGKIDLILMDFLLPDMNGMELVDYMNEGDIPGYYVPKVVLTAMFNDYSTAKNYFQDRFDGIILKPFEPDELVKMIDSL